LRPANFEKIVPITAYKLAQVIEPLPVCKTSIYLLSLFSPRLYENFGTWQERKNWNPGEVSWAAGEGCSALVTEEVGCAAIVTM
jgi:hypothetical protein